MGCELTAPPRGRGTGGDTGRAPQGEEADVLS